MSVELPSPSSASYTSISMELCRVIVNVFRRFFSLSLSNVYDLECNFIYLHCVFITSLTKHLNSRLNSVEISSKRFSFIIFVSRILYFNVINTQVWWVAAQILHWKSIKWANLQYFNVISLRAHFMNSKNDCQNNKLYLNKASETK